MKRVVVAVVLVGAAVGLGACAPSSPNRDDTRDWLVREIGFNDAQATCVVDQVWADDSDDLREELAEQTPDLDQEDEDRLAQLVQACTTGN